MKLVGDIGGTKTLLALADSDYRLHRVARFANDDYADFAAVLQTYAPGLIDGGCLAVAGPVSDDGRHAHLTNRPWEIDCAALEQTLGLRHLTLINDFAGAALGVPLTASDQLACLQAGQPRADGVRLVLGAGTGLGVATLLPRAGGGWQVIPGEGGHIGFAPQNDMQDALCRWLRPSVGRVINEHLLSGGGIAAIHAFLAGLAVEAPRLQADEIARRAGTDDTLAQRTMQVFAGIYGAVAGDLALLTLARGGVYLAGGIAGKNLDLMQDGSFLAAFNAKGVYNRLTTQMPVHVVTEPNLALLGAALAD